MTYSTGQTIVDSDYNTFATGSGTGTPDNNTANINTIWGIGTGRKGYGQTSTVSAVSAGNTITATQWATLLSRMTSIGNHQGTSITAIGNPSTGQTITAYAALSTNISTLFTDSNASSAAANGADSSASTTTTGTWDVRAQTTKTVTFASANQLRYFFNAGGHIRMSFSLTGTSGDAKSLEWADLLSQTGTIVASGWGGSKTIAGVSYAGTTKIGGAGSPTTLASATGVYDYTGTPVTIFQQYADEYVYNANYIQIQASISGNVVSFAVTLEDAAADELAPGAITTGEALDVVDGTLTMTTVIRPPSTTYISSTWGSVTQNAATWTLTS